LVIGLINCQALEICTNVNSTVPITIQRNHAALLSRMVAFFCEK
jgi:hypothetical protein